MGLEVTTTIAGLVSTNPTATDSVTQGDDHIRLIKDVLKTIFPGVGGSGLAEPITATEDELNSLVGVTGTLGFPIATAMLFYQSSAPTGWTATSSPGSKTMIVFSGDISDGGTSGGSHSPILMDKVPSHTHAFTSGTESATHTHTDAGHTHVIGTNEFIMNAYGTANQVSSDGQNFIGRYGVSDSGTANLGTESATHTHSGTTDANGSAANWQPYHSFVILCTKDL